MAHRTPRQLAVQRRIDGAVRLVAPALDLLLFAGHHVSRWAGRDQLDPEPARRSVDAGRVRSPIGGGPDGAPASPRRARAR